MAVQHYTNGHSTTGLHDASDHLKEEPLPALLRRLSEQTSTLVRQEIDLAKAEFQEKGKQAGTGLAMFGGTGLFGLGAFGALTTMLIAALATGMATWVAALIVTIVYGAIAAVLAVTGKERVQEAMPPKPEQTIETVKEDVQWAKTQKQSVGK